MDRVRVGTIGCGGIAQIMHLPYLRELDERFELAALCDVDREKLDLVGDRFGIGRRFTSADDLLAEPLDAVIIMSSGDHADLVLSALAAGRHVFCEKPLAYTLRKADEILEAERRSGLALMVGMMKRFDAGYRLGAAAVAELTDLRLVEAHVLNPDNELYWSHHDIRRPGGRSTGPGGRGDGGYPGRNPRPGAA